MNYIANSATTQNPHYRRWMSIWLYAAAIYNIIWGAFVIIAPNAIFNIVGAEPPLYPQLWQCVGMIVGVYGLGYAAAARDPLKHWPIIAVGLLGKVLGPIGFIDAVFIKESFPIGFGATILTNDLLWWAPFTLILIATYRQHKDNTNSQASNTTTTTNPDEHGAPSA